MRILVTGATGLLGRHLLPRLAGHDVFALSRAPAPDGDARVTWIHHDLSGPLDRALLPERLDAIVHLAQSERHDDGPDGFADVFAVNVRSTAELLEYGRAADIRSFVLASTGGVYGLSAEPISEDAPCTVESPYYRSKLIAELLAKDYAPLFDCVVLRLFFVYGEGRSRMLVARLADRILRGETIVVEGDPGLRINPIYAGDAAAAIDAALALGRSETFNVAGAEVVTVTDLAERIAAALDRRVQIRHTGEGPPADLVANTERLRSGLGFIPPTDLDLGLAAVARSLTASEAG